MTTPMVQNLNRILDGIDHKGWSVITTENPTRPTIGYSVGFWQSFQHPEICILGIPTATAVFTLNQLGEWIKRGDRIAPDRVYEDVFPQLVMFKAISPQHFALMYYLYGPEYQFSALQLIWADEGNRFPWEDGYAYDPQGQMIDGERYGKP